MSVLSRIAAVPGVAASAMFDDDMRCLDHRGAAPFDKKALVSAMRELSEVVAILSSSYDTRADGGLTTLYLDAADGWVALRRFDAHTILCLGRQAPNRAMLKVALSAASGRGKGEPVTGRRTRPSTADLFPLGEAEPLDIDVIKRLLELLQQYLGPAARPAVKRELKALGATPRSLGRDAFPYLVEQLAVRISNPSWQDEFRREARQLLPPT